MTAAVHSQQETVHPRTRVWIETHQSRALHGPQGFTLARGCGLKPPRGPRSPAGGGVHPRTRVWIETFSVAPARPSCWFTLARGCGLKRRLDGVPRLRAVHPRTRVWIETRWRPDAELGHPVHPRTRVWIETRRRSMTTSAPVVHPRTRVWIETDRGRLVNRFDPDVHPRTRVWIGTICNAATTPASSSPSHEGVD